MSRRLSAAAVVAGLAVTLPTGCARGIGEASPVVPGARITSQSPAASQGTSPEALRSVSAEMAATLEAVEATLAAVESELAQD